MIENRIGESYILIFDFGDDVKRRFYSLFKYLLKETHYNVWFSYDHNRAKDSDYEFLQKKSNYVTYDTSEFSYFRYMLKKTRIVFSFINDLDNNNNNKYNSYDDTKLALETQRDFFNLLPKDIDRCVVYLGNYDYETYKKRFFNYVTIKSSFPKEDIFTPSYYRRQVLYTIENTLHESQDTSYDVILLYDCNRQLVLAFYDHLTQDCGLKVWVDFKNMTCEHADVQMNKLVKNSKMIIKCECNDDEFCVGPEDDMTTSLNQLFINSLDSLNIPFINLLITPEILKPGERKTNRFERFERNIAKISSKISCYLKEEPLSVAGFVGVSYESSRIEGVLNTDIVNKPKRYNIYLSYADNELQFALSVYKCLIKHNFSVYMKFYENLSHLKSYSKKKLLDSTIMVRIVSNGSSKQSNQSEFEEAKIASEAAIRSVDIITVDDASVIKADGENRYKLFLPKFNTLLPFNWRNKYGDDLCNMISLRLRDQNTYCNVDVYLSYHVNSLERVKLIESVLTSQSIKVFKADIENEFNSIYDYNGDAIMVCCFTQDYLNVLEKHKTRRDKLQCSSIGLLLEKVNHIPEELSYKGLNTISINFTKTNLHAYNQSYEYLLNIIKNK